MSTQVSPEQAQFRKAFGIFVGVFNEVNGTSHSVEYALKQIHMLNLFKNLKEAAQEVNKYVKPNTKASTKRKSYDALNIPNLDNKVFEFIKENPRKSRAAISEDLEMRLQTVCGCVNRLIKAKLIYASGTTRDRETGKEVEVLSAQGG